MVTQRQWPTCILIVGLCLSAETGFAEVDWHPSRTRVFAVGVLEWQNPEVWRGMANAKVNRRDIQLVQYFKSAGITDDRITYLQDQQATRSRIQTELVNQLSHTKPGELLILYFTGHGFRDHKSQEVHFANYDADEGASAWRVRSIFDTLDNHFTGSQVLLIADCCYSGALVDEARARKTPLNCACLCSSYSHNSSTGRWTFTDALLAGLRGSPVVDLNEDGEIDFDEMGRYSELEMAFVERQKSVYHTTHNFSSRWRLSKPAHRRTPRQGERLEAEWNGKWYRAEVREASGSNCKIHYVGYDDKWDEWVGPDRMRPYQPPDLAQGLAVQVQWSKDKKWYPAHVVRSWYGLMLVHYDGFPDEWNEWVNPDSIRVRAE